MSTQEQSATDRLELDVTAFLGRLRRALDDRGFSQARLARELGVGEATVSEWFTRQRVPHGDVFLRLPRVLKLNGHWLLTGNGPMNDPDPGGDAFRTGAREVLEHLRQFHAIHSSQYGKPAPDTTATPGGPVAEC